MPACTTLAVEHLGVAASTTTLTAAALWRGAAVAVVVPTAVRVEAGWDRSDPRAAAVNRFRVLDAVLDRQPADTAAAILVRTAVSVADAHLGAVARTSPVDQVVVLTSDPGDVVRSSDPRTVTVIRI